MTGDYKFTIEEENENKILNDMLTKLISELLAKSFESIDLLTVVLPHRRLDYAAMIGREMMDLGMIKTVVTASNVSRGDGGDNPETFDAHMDMLKRRLLERLGQKFDKCVACEKDDEKKEAKS